MGFTTSGNLQSRSYEKRLSLFRRNFGNEFGLFIHSLSQIHRSLAREKRDFEDARARLDWLSSWSSIFTILTLVFLPQKNYGINLVLLQDLKEGVNVKAVLTSLNTPFCQYLGHVSSNAKSLCLFH